MRGFATKSAAIDALLPVGPPGMIYQLPRRKKPMFKVCGTGKTDGRFASLEEISIAKRTPRRTWVEHSEPGC